MNVCNKNRLNLNAQVWLLTLMLVVVFSGSNNRAEGSFDLARAVSQLGSKLSAENIDLTFRESRNNPIILPHFLDTVARFRDRVSLTGLVDGSSIPELGWSQIYVNAVFVGSAATLLRVSLCDGDCDSALIARVDSVHLQRGLSESSYIPTSITLKANGSFRGLALLDALSISMSDNSLGKYLVGANELVAYRTVLTASDDSQVMNRKKGLEYPLWLVFAKFETDASSPFTDKHTGEIQIPLRQQMVFVTIDADNGKGLKLKRNLLVEPND